MHKIKNINQLISTIFTESNFDSTPLEDPPAMLFKKRGIADYWIVVKSEDINSFLEMQANYYRSAKNLAENEAFDKNLSVLILFEGTKDYLDIKNNILKIEEDPYLAKKHVLFYSPNELSGLLRSINILSNANSPITRYLSQEASSSHNFKNYTTAEHTDRVRLNLIYKLFIKLPFLDLNLPQENEQEFDDLSLKIEDGLISENVYDTHEIYLSALLHQDIDEVKDMNADAILKIFKTNNEPESVDK